MSKIRIHPGKIEGVIEKIGASKSQLHRALILSSLRKGVSFISPRSTCQDVQETIACLKVLGVGITENENGYQVKSNGISFAKYRKLSVQASASTFRFLLPLVAHFTEESEWVLGERLRQRPNAYLSFYPHEKTEQGWKIYQKDLEEELSIPGEDSSQFATGFLFFSLARKKKTVLHLSEKQVSFSYWKCSLQMAYDFGANIIEKSKFCYEILPTQPTSPFSFHAEIDASSYAFFFALATLNGDVYLPVIEKKYPQSDWKIIEMLEDVGAQIALLKHAVHVVKTKNWKPLDVDLKDCPDLAPILFTIASMLPLTSHFYHTHRLSGKESDRVQNMKEELEKIGAEWEVYPDFVEIKGSTSFPQNLHFSSHNDHRIAMALSLLAMRVADSFTIEHSEVVKKSFPEFWQILRKTGLHLEEIDSSF